MRAIETGKKETRTKKDREETGKGKNRFRKGVRMTPTFTQQRGYKVGQKKVPKVRQLNP